MCCSKANGHLLVDERERGGGGDQAMDKSRIVIAYNAWTLTTLLLLLIARTKFCDFAITTILRVLILRFHEVELNFASRATKCSTSSSTLKSTGLVNVAVSRPPDM